MCHIFIPKLQELSCGQIKQSLVGKYMLCLTLKDGFLESKLLILP